MASVGGDVFAVDKTSVIITNFTHDGTDPGKQIQNIMRENINQVLQEHLFMLEL